MREAEAGFAAEPSWRFRILRADVLLARSDVTAAKALLESPQPPTDGELLARLRMAQGYAEYLTSNYPRAEQLLQQAGRTAKPLGLPWLDAMIENRAGLVDVQQGRMDAAERSFRHVIEVAAEQRDPYLQSTAEHNLGFLFENAFRFEDAIYWFEKAGAMFHELGSLNSYYVALGNVGTCYLRLGDLDQGLKGRADLTAALEQRHARQPRPRRPRSHRLGPYHRSPPRRRLRPSPVRTTAGALPPSPQRPRPSPPTGRPSRPKGEHEERQEHDGLPRHHLQPVHRE